MDAVPRDVSVVVPAHNASGTVSTLLDALEGQTLARERFELIVVDDGSTDSTADEVRARGWPILISTKDNVGVWRARNVGIAKASSPLLALTDADCVPDPDWLERGLARFAADPALDILAGGITVTLPAKPSTAALIDAARYLDQEKYARDGFSVTAAMWVRTRLVRDVGGFNERLAKMGHADHELGRLLTSVHGAKLTYAPEVHLTHPPRAKLGGLARKSYRLGRGSAAWRRHARIPVARRPLFLGSRRLLPRASLRRVDRLKRRGVNVTLPRRVRMGVAEILFVSLPLVWGDVVGTCANAFERLRAPRARSPRPT